VAVAAVRVVGHVHPFVIAAQRRKTDEGEQCCLQYAAPGDLSH
jgi:hypothetical protein